MLALLLPLLTSCRSDRPGDTPVGSDAGSAEVSTDGGEETPQPPGEGVIELFRDGKCLYKTVIRSENASSAELETAKRLHRALREKSPDILIDTDYRYREGVMEIVVATSSETYPEIAELQQGLRYNDYVIAKVGSKLIITAMGEQALDNGVSKVIRSITASMNEDTEDFSIQEIYYEAEYDIRSFTVSGKDIRDFTIVYPADGVRSEAEAALAWQVAIGEAYGCRLPVSDDTAPVSANEILIGRTNRAESEGQAVDFMSYELNVVNGKLVIDAGGMYSFQYAADEYFSTLRRQDVTEVALTDGTKTSGTLLTAEPLERTDDTDVRIMSANILAEFPNWNNTLKECPVEPRVEILLGSIAFYQPDVIAVQELSANWAKQLHEKLDENYVLICDVFPDGQENYSALIYNKNTLELLSSEIVRYSVGDNPKCRNMGIGEFRVRATGKEFCMISTHWNLGANKTIVQGEEIWAKMQELSLGGTRAVLAGGDFNSSPTTDTYLHMMEISTLQNLKEVAGEVFNDVGTVKPGVGLPSAANSTTIDYIFGTEDVRCSRFLTIIGNRTVDLSDHNGLLVDVSIP